MRKKARVRLSQLAAVHQLPLDAQPLKTGMRNAQKSTGALVTIGSSASVAALSYSRGSAQYNAALAPRGLPR
jgi:hypothetical protein